MPKPQPHQPDTDDDDGERNLGADEPPDMADIQRLYLRIMGAMEGEDYGLAAQALINALATCIVQTATSLDDALLVPERITDDMQDCISENWPRFRGLEQPDAGRA